MIFEQRYHGPMRTILPIAVVVVLVIGFSFRFFGEDITPRRGHQLVEFVHSIPSPTKLPTLSYETLEKTLTLKDHQKGPVRLVLQKLEGKKVQTQDALWELVSLLERPQQDRLATLLK